MHRLLQLRRDLSLPATQSAFYGSLQTRGFPEILAIADPVFRAEAALNLLHPRKGRAMHVTVEENLDPYVVVAFENGNVVVELLTNRLRQPGRRRYESTIQDSGRSTESKRRSRQLATSSRHERRYDGHLPEAESSVSFGASSLQFIRQPFWHETAL